MPPSNERRFAIDGWQSVDFQVRAVEDGDGMTFEGYAAVFNQDSDGAIPGFGVEQIAPGAFKQSLGIKGRDIKMFLNHNSDLVLASRSAGTLQLTEDEIGLKASARFIDTTAGLDTAKNVAAGNVSKMSFGFTPDKMKKRDDVEGVIHTRVALWEVSPVTSWPAYTGTSATVRHLAELAEVDFDEFETALSRYLHSQELSEDQVQYIISSANRLAKKPWIAPETAAILSSVRSHEADLASVAASLGLAK